MTSFPNLQNNLKNLIILAAIVFTLPQSYSWASEQSDLQNKFSLLQSGKFQSSSEFDELRSKADFASDVIYYYEGLFWKNQEKLSEAKIAFQKSLGARPSSHLQTLLELELIKIDMVASDFSNRNQLKKTEARLRRMERFHRSDVKHAEIVFLQAQVQRRLSLIGEFCKSVRKLYTEHPEYPPVIDWNSQIASNIFMGHPTGCSVSPDDKRRRIRNLIWAGFSEKAKTEIADLKKALAASDPFLADRLEVHYLTQEGKVLEALEVLKSRYEEKKDNYSYLVLAANTMARGQNLSAGVGLFDRAYQLTPNSKQGREALFQAAFLAYQAQDYDGATRRFQLLKEDHGSSKQGRDASWFLAWMSYLKADYPEAIRQFQGLLKLRRSYSDQVTPERVKYWLGMSYFGNGQVKAAKATMEDIKKDRSKGFYALLATQRLIKWSSILSDSPVHMVGSELSDMQNLVAAVDPNLSSAEMLETNESVSESESTDESVVSDEPTTEAAESSSEEVEVFSESELESRFQRVKSFAKLGLYDWAKWELIEMEKRTRNRDYLRRLISEYEKLEIYNRSSSLAQIDFGTQRLVGGFERSSDLWQSAFPLAYAKEIAKSSEEFGVPSELIWSIMRAESHYNKLIISPVGAMGLMQIMPATGKRLSYLIRDSEFQPEQLLGPATAIRYGAKYLDRLMRQMDQSIPLVAASYNAGPHRVNGWLQQLGGLEMDEFIEHIPFRETRNYVKKVTSYFWIYTQLYKKSGSNSSVNPFGPLQSLTEPINFRGQEGALATHENWD